MGLSGIFERAAEAVSDVKERLKPAFERAEDVAYDKKSNRVMAATVILGGIAGGWLMGGISFPLVVGLILGSLPTKIATGLKNTSQRPPQHPGP